MIISFIEEPIATSFIQAPYMKTDRFLSAEIFHEIYFICFYRYNKDTIYTVLQGQAK